MTTHNGHKTAITRTKLSAPMRYLQNEGWLHGRMLDYGCGKGQDADEIGMDKYDPHFFPNLKDGHFDYDVITCNYVLNVIPTESERLEALCKIAGRLHKDGIALITVRRDIKQDGWTSKGTYQETVELPFRVLREVKGGYITYAATMTDLCLYYIEQTKKGEA